MVTSAHAARLTPVLAAAQDAGARVALIDTAPHAADVALMAARAADLVLIPCRPSAADLHAIGGTIDLTRIAETRAVVVINSAPVNNPVVGQAQVAIAGYHIEAVPVVIHHRIDHVHASPRDWPPRSGRPAARPPRNSQRWPSGFTMPKQPQVDLATAVHGAAQKTEPERRLPPQPGTKPSLRGESRLGKKGILIHVEPENPA